MPDTRQQLSMYAAADAVKDIEALRAIVDPVQHGLIPAHITLCREDELADYPAIKNRLQKLSWSVLSLRFGRPEVFSGHGILLHCIDGEDEFHHLREHLLDSIHIRNQRPHITIAHPRNPQASGNALAQALTLPETITVRFPAIYLIEQTGREPWRILETYALTAAPEAIDGGN
ncbi:2'-5' RNA ligase family protein [Undibacterium sp. TJN19]|uniref:2'-5' RNA ligase family protein n=1 Tax=Undibacterium sp. TJN19 TaxID=3413055 RepID=UPI003BF435BB